MSEYIERWALEGAFDAATMAFLEKEDNLFDRKSVLAGMSIAAGIVHTVPAADVAPVAHGRWEEIRDPYGMLTGWIHTECGREVKCADNYCPKCGAKMDLVDEQEGV